MAKKVERTQPGSKLDWRVTYDTGSKKWTNDRPGDGKGDPEEKENLFDDLTVKRGIDRLEKAISGFAGGTKGPGDIRKAVEQLEQYAGVDAARTAIRAIYKAVSGKDGGGKATKGAGIAKGHANRGRKKARESRIAGDIVAGWLEEQNLSRFEEMVEAGVIRDEGFIEKVRRNPRRLEMKRYRWQGTGYGGLGAVRFENFYAHWKAGVKRHRWEFETQVGSSRNPNFLITTFECEVCGTTTKKTERARQ